MKKFLFFSLITIMCFSSFGFPVPKPDTNENQIEVFYEPSLDDFFTIADQFFASHVTDGKVDYTTIKSDRTILDQLDGMIGSADLSSSDANTKTAFYLNAYNLLVIKSVINKYPINKPTDVSGFFDATKHQIAGEYLTLNEIENKKLRPDPRVHFSLVCAAKGCPKIINEAFKPSTVQAQLDRQAKRAMNDASFIKVDDATKSVKISQIFEWYRADFIKQPGANALVFINQYRDVRIPPDYSVGFYEYDWNLNKK